MPSLKRNQIVSFFDLFERFINNCKAGRRLQPNGKKISAGTLRNYKSTLLLVRRFCKAKQFDLRIKSVRKLNQRERNTEKVYWKKFYKQLTDYMYNDNGYFDNSVGSNMKRIRCFFGYLNKELSLEVGEYYKFFYSPKEDIKIFTLMPEELNFLIYDQKFTSSLSKRMKEVKDFVVFGCTVALRFSDLEALKKINLRTINNEYYLAVRSGKTSTDTLIKLPDYAIDIIKRQRKNSRKLLPHFNISNLNEYIKKLVELAGFTQTVQTTRNRRGMPVQIDNNGSPLRFCDVCTTHTMRRTAITTMLSLGIREQVVRKISGHEPNSKEFYRYVLWAQTYMDTEIGKMFEKLKEKN